MTGKITNHEFKDGEIVALGMDGRRYKAPIAANRHFRIELPGNSTYVLYFQQDSLFNDALELSAGTLDDDGDEDYIGAQLVFEESLDVGMRDSLRLPKILLESELNLGEVDIKGNEAFPTINPATRLDYDLDGISDFADLDDQNDGIGDREQRQAIERVEICHFSADRRPSDKVVPLSHLLSHLNHGDSIGPCRYVSDDVFR